MQNDRDTLFYIREHMHFMLLNRKASLWKEIFSLRNEYKGKDTFVYQKEETGNPKEDPITNDPGF